MSIENPASVHEANKMVRVLRGKPLAFTVQIHRQDGRILEFQTNTKPDVKWNDQLREPWIYEAGYEGYPICQHQTGDVILCEKNDSAK